MSPDSLFDPSNDLALDAEQLRTKYEGLAADGEWGEHPNFPMEEWQAVVRCNHTRVGYWDWVVTKLQTADDNTAKNAISTDAEEEELVELQTEDPGNQGA